MKLINIYFRRILNFKMEINKVNDINSPDYPIKKPISFDDRVKGGIYGSLIGDTVGSTIEFKMNISDDMIKQCF